MTKGIPYIILTLILTSAMAFGQVEAPKVAEDVKRVSFMEAQFKRIPVANNVFVPKGQWILGTTMSYTEHTNDNYTFIVAKKINTSGHNISPKLFAGYAFADNAVGGVRFEFKRSLLDIGNIDLELMEGVSMNISNASSERNTFFATLFLRNYLSLFNSRRFAIFNDTEISVGGGHGKILQDNGTQIGGLFEQVSEFHIGISPGMTVFATDNIALEVAVGVLGFSSTWTKQYTDQVYEGTKNTNKGSFKIDLFSVKIGVVFYFNNKNFITNHLGK